MILFSIDAIMMLNKLEGHSIRTHENETWQGEMMMIVVITITGWNYLIYYGLLEPMIVYPHGISGLILCVELVFFIMWKIWHAEKNCDQRVLFWGSMPNPNQKINQW